MNIQMPDMDGTHACIALKLIDKQTPLVALTANVMPAGLKRCAQVGFDAPTGKPIDMGLLYAKVQDLVR